MIVETRNTIILAVVWLLLSAGGFLYVNFWLVKDVDELAKTQKEFADFPNLITEVNLLALRSTEMKQKYLSRRKEIPPADQASKSYGNIMSILDQAGDVKVDVKTMERVNLASWGYDAYMFLQGEGQFASFYKLIYLLENGRFLYRIHNLSLTHDPANETQRPMNFQMEVHAYYSKIADLGNSFSEDELTIPPTPYSLFTPPPTRVVQKEKPPAGLIDANDIEVKIVMSGKAFVQYKKASMFLQVGDPVWRGYVSGIDTAQGKVEFTLKVDGVTRKIEKRIKHNKKG